MGRVIKMTSDNIGLGRGSQGHVNVNNADDDKMWNGKAISK